MQHKHIKINNDITLGNDLPLVLIAGPCQIESREHAMEVAEALNYIAEELNIKLIYKSSFDKANRSSINGVRGIGLAQAMPIFDEIRSTFKCPIITDIHTEDQCQIVAQHVDILQIPAFLCRQTDLLVAAAKTGKVINVKKGQFLAPDDMKNVVKKISDSKNDNILLTERGVSFGYNTLVSDMRSLTIMGKTGYPVIYDATHSIQQPGGLGNASGGQREFVATLSRAAVAIGVAAVFLETHPDPDKAPSDGPCMVHLKDMPKLISELKQIDQMIKSF
jgi:2-dehydro-3-deoxyphosphooctonate aldolase (KDO 8-P synthase)